MNQEELIAMIRDYVLVKKTERKIIRTDGFTDAEYLFDFRNVLLNQEHLPKLARALAELLESYDDYQICGLESAAIPLVTALVMITGKSGFYIRKSRKKTGLMNMIEGRVDPLKKIIIIDDIMNSGNSIMRQVRILESYGLKVSGVCTILQYRDASCYTELLERRITSHSLLLHRDIAESLGISHLPDISSHKPAYEIMVPKWRFSVPDPAYQLVVPKSTPCYYDGRIYVGMDDGGLYCLDAITGREIWKYQTPFGSKGKRILSSPCVYSNTVFFGAYDGNIYALDCDTGVPVWIDYSADWIGSSPCAVPEMNAICIGIESSSAHARGGYELFEARTGRSIWKTESSQYTHASPVYSRQTNTIFGGSNDGIFYAIDAHTGTLRWVFAAGSEIKSRAALNASETLVAFGCFSGIVFVLDVTTGKLVSSYKAEFAVYSEPCWYNHVLYFSSLDKRLYAYDTEEQVLKWEYCTAGRVFSSPVIIGECIYIGSNDGNIYILDRDTGKLVKMWLGIERITNPIIPTGNDGFLVRTFANEIYAF